LHLVLAGPHAEAVSGKLKAYLAAHNLTHRVIWPGLLNGDLKYGAFYAAEVFALISHQENFGVAVVEALACGLPVLLSQKVNIWREIVESKAGLAAADDERGALELLEGWLAKSTDERSEFRANAHACFSERYEIGSATNNLIATLRSEGVAG
jgi:glycosyltransferase involved in cell wall biosynthesis